MVFVGREEKIMRSSHKVDDLGLLYRLLWGKLGFGPDELDSEPGAWKWRVNREKATELRLGILARYLLFKEKEDADGSTIDMTDKYLMYGA
ncbi:hypothetical protein WG66_004046 [Moniliophthora roreri]|uniref:Uncharacterized protein n=1 Tax=Moniliophthora roreri TaxID=221103 RepID=A0A0W0F251_MONRR|nr:hypothetical protein WG66_004046 [Moniliophthora roreri]